MIESDRPAQRLACAEAIEQVPIPVIVLLPARFQDRMADPAIGLTLFGLAGSPQA